MQEFAPRGWRAALAAERQGVARLQATARQSAESVSRHAGRVTSRLLTPLVTSVVDQRLSEQELPWGAPREPQAECPSPAAAVPDSTAWSLGQHHWLLAVAGVAVVAFVAGWLSGRWHLRRQRGRRQETMQQARVPTTAAAAGGATAAAAVAATAAAQAAPDTASLAAAAEQGQQRAAGWLADAAGPAGASRLSGDKASPEQASQLQPVAATAAPAVLAADGATGHADEPLQAAAVAATAQPCAEDASRRPAMAQATTGPASAPTQLAEDEAAEGVPARQQQQRAPALASASNRQQQQPPDVQEMAVAKAQPTAAAGTTEASSEVSSAAAQQPPLQSEASHPAEAEESWTNAAQLVAVVAQRLGVRIDDLSAGEKIQLITAAIGAWQTFQQRDHHRDAFAQGDAANAMRSQHNRLVAAGITDKRARHQSQQALRGVARLQQSLADCTVLGLALQALAALYCGTRYGLLHTRLAACPAASRGGVSLLRPWEVLAPLQAAACWVFTIGDVLLGVLIVLGTCFVVLRTRLLASYHVMPLNKLLLGLGCACGCLGYFAISKLGGSPQLWLGLWWTWIGGQCALVMNLDAVHALLQPPEQAQANGPPAVKWVAGSTGMQGRLMKHP